MKYIMFEKSCKKIPFIFPSLCVHEHIAKAVLKTPEMKGAKVVSAGDFDPMVCHCYGESETLKVKSNPVDGDIIRSYDYNCGY